MADTSKITLGQLKTALTQAKNYTDNEIANVTGISKIEPENLDMPKVFFYGNALPTTKDNVNLTMDYVSNTDKFTSYVNLKCQGTSSMSYNKKNFTVSMFSDESRTIKLKKDFKGWGAQSKFCLKANYVDTTHTRNLSGARIAYDMVNSRPDSPFKQQLLQCPRNGAVDGFPIKLYFNGEFYGIYTWNIPKDGWMFNMDESNPNHMVLCAEKNNDSTNVSDDILRCEFRKEWDGTDGNSWSIEFGTYSNTLKNSFNRCVNFVMTATDEEFKANIGNYFDLYSLLDYYCFSYLVAHIDGLAKNMLMVTYDGVIWGASLYDMDSIYGADWQGTQFKATNIQCPEQYQDTNSLLWQRIESCFSTELYARYLELRQGALSLSNIIKHVEEIHDVIPDRVFADEKAKWTSLPGVNTNTITRFRNYMRDRAVYVDAQLKEIGDTIPCTGIILSADTLSFTTTDTQTLSVVVSPTNCTDMVTWSVSPSNVVSVDNGVVTPIANGDCTITATCGSKTDTCSVNVALPVVECTSISLDKTELSLGVFEGGNDTPIQAETISLAGKSWTGGSISTVSGKISSSTSGDVYTSIDIQKPGIYTTKTSMGYTYKKLVLYDSNNIYITYSGNSELTTEASICILQPCTLVIGLYLNGLTIDSNSMELTFEPINTNSINKDITYTPKASDVNVRYTGTDYVFSELYLDTQYNMYAVTYNGNDYFSYSAPFVNANDAMINHINNGTNHGMMYNSDYAGKSFIPIATPKDWGTTADAILTHISTITVNPSNVINSLYNTIQSILSTQLTATVTPENCTQPVVWTVSPEGIVTVNNGLVTAVTNGGATVTATCGSQTATCAVTVSGMSESGGNTNYLANAQ